MTLALSLALLAFAPAARADEPRIVLEGGIGGTSLLPFPEAGNLEARICWQANPWFGLAVEGELYDYAFLIPMGGALHAGPILRPWALGAGRVTPYLTGQIGVVGFAIPDTDASGARELRAEAGLELPVGKRGLLTLGGGVAQLHADAAERLMGFGRVMLGAYF